MARTQKSAAASEARKQDIIRAVIAANPDLSPTRLAKIVELVLRLDRNRSRR